MSRKTQIILVALAALPGMAAGLWLVGGQGEARSKEAYREIKDMTGRVVQIPAEPRQILSLCSSATDTIVRIGEGEKIAAIDEYNRIIPGVTGATVIGKGSAISQEQILSLGIDLAFIWWYQDDAASLLKKLSVPTTRIRSGRAKEVPQMIRLVGECLNCSIPADNLANGVAEYVRTATIENAGSQKKRVYLELYGPFKTVGRDTYISDLIELAGAENIADEVSGSLLISAEQLIETAPDVILFVKGFETVKSIARRSGMAKMLAVQDERIYSMDRYWLVAGAGLPVAVENFRKFLIKNKASHNNSER
ncbi:MAG: ABC transporter substrate-binding protein [Anaerohalosphaeraceae bacterium]|nr:ABC transporter substrate-binding protein [Anaerohalosphaeraceae bacterium]